jgi:hypothetical protein
MLVNARIVACLYCFGNLILDWCGAVVVINRDCCGLPRVNCLMSFDLVLSFLHLAFVRDLVFRIRALGIDFRMSDAFFLVVFLLF